MADIENSVERVLQRHSRVRAEAVRGLSQAGLILDWVAGRLDTTGFDDDRADELSRLARAIRRHAEAYK